MNKMNLKNCQNIAVLTQSGIDYIAVVDRPESPYNLFPGNTSVTPDVSLWEMTADENCMTDQSKYITDDNGVTYQSIVGPRPRNIMKR